MRSIRTLALISVLFLVACGKDMGMGGDDGGGDDGPIPEPAWSIDVDLSTLEGVDPLLLAFLSAKDQATTPYSLPGVKAMQERGWDDCATGIDTLLVGESAEAAVDAYVQELSKYKTA